MWFVICCHNPIHLHASGSSVLILPSLAPLGDPDFRSSSQSQGMLRLYTDYGSWNGSDSLFTQIMAPLAALLLPSLEAASSREELLRACRRVCTSAGVRSRLLSAPQFFDFVAKAVGATDPSDSELADAVEELLKGTTASLQEAYYKSSTGEMILELGDARLLRSIFGAIGAIVDAAKRPRPYISMQCFAFPMRLILIFRRGFKLAPHMRFSVPTLVGLHRQLLELHTVASGFAGLGPAEKLRAFLCVVHSAKLIGIAYIQVAHREGFASSNALTTSLLRHSDFMGQPSGTVTDDLWTDLLQGIIACASVSTLEAALQPDFGLNLDFSDLPGERVASIARALGICMGRKWHHQEQLDDESFIFVILDIATHGELLLHACAFLEAPGCLRQIVQVMDSFEQFDDDILEHCTTLVISAATRDPIRMAPLLRTPDCILLVDVVFRPKAIELLDGNQYRGVVHSYLTGFSGSSPEAATPEQIEQAFAKARRLLPCLPAYQRERGRSATASG